MSLYSELKRRNVIRVAVVYAAVAWLLIEVADTVYPHIGLPDWTVTFVIAALALGFPLAMALSWAYELTPEGLKKTHEVDLAESITHLTGRKLDFLIIAVLAVALGYFLLDKFFVSGEGPAGVAPAADRASIAVLPFVNLSADPEQEYFSDGLSEEILNLLAQIQSLKVIGRTSSFAFKGRNEDLRSIAAALDVAYLLQGSVRKSGDQLRITAQLIQATDGSHLWSQSYDRRLENVFGIQSEIAEAIAGALRLNLGGTPGTITAPRGTASLPAYDLYWRARRLMRDRTRPNLEAARGLLDEALALDPDYPAALAARAEVWILLSARSYGDIPPKRATAEARALVDRAIALDPRLAEAHATAGLMYQHLADWESAEAALARALELNPSLSEALSWRSNYLGWAGRLRDEVAARRRHAEIDPLNVLAVSTLALPLIESGELEAAIALGLRVQRAFPDGPQGYAREIRALVSAGRLAEALPPAERMLAVAPTEGLTRSTLATLFLALGEYGRVLELPRARPRIFALLALHRPEEAIAEAKRLADAADAVPGDPFFALDLMNVLSLAGRHATVLEVYGERWGSLPALESTVGYMEYSGEMAPIAVAQRATGDEAGLAATTKRWGQRLAYLREQGYAHSEFLYEAARFEALAGTGDAAVAALAAAIDRGYRYPLLAREPAFAGLQSNPDFGAAVSRMTELIDTERAKLDLPPL